ncbi:hypothetical protein ASC77_04560 [Nocardioides sp. Root1257]|uniref:hypothetical protein n=1 Tax=unclassified Nocardioides TaxID=2615069 RepID=UPI000700F286|nr:MULTISPECIES: hypothetical protein [unclassified Nocardioides]KQW53550.1 hypothetical protein ASC77_04560 [Nocardioides sp. Root1257]KRC56236.1 hypothetical protein ASE24_04560 [Nocardioides sp. Root224]
MLAIVVVMVLILVVAGLVAAYAAYPHRGERMPAAPWLGDAMAKAADAAPVIEEQEQKIFGFDAEYEDSERRR